VSDPARLQASQHEADLVAAHREDVLDAHATGAEAQDVPDGWWPLKSHPPRRDDLVVRALLVSADDSH
jgi:hypothetical protein